MLLSHERIYRRRRRHDRSKDRKTCRKNQPEEGRLEVHFNCKETEEKKLGGVMAGRSKEAPRGEKVLESELR